jgi:hypothetical protein
MAQDQPSTVHGAACPTCSCSREDDLPNAGERFWAKLVQNLIKLETIASFWGSLGGFIKRRRQAGKKVKDAYK